MITPVFEVRQDEEFIIVEMRVPHLKVSTFDFYIEKGTFKFYGKPYFLRLEFQKELVEDGREKSAYDVSTGLLTVHLPKKDKNDIFEDLDLLTLLKSKPSNKIPITPIIEQMKSNPTGNIVIETLNSTINYDPSDADNIEKIIDIVDNNDAENPINSVDDLFDWELPQSLPIPISTNLTNKFPYGFNLSYNSYFEGLQEELSEIIELQDPNSPLDIRQQTRFQSENDDFNIDHYLCDFVHNEEIKEIIRYTPFWESTPEAPSIKSPASIISLPSDTPSTSIFSDEEKEVLRDLKNKEFLIDTKEERALLLGLIDIIFAFVYDHITTLGESTVESSWTISKISATLSHLVVFDNLPQTVISCFRRSLTYPLYCNWELSYTVWNHTKSIFKMGKRHLLKSLLAIKQMFQFSDFKRHLNTIYIDDYCVWIQSVSPKSIKHLSKKLAEYEIGKDQLGWNLTELEELKDELEEQYEENS